MREYNVVDAIWFNNVGIVRVRPEVGEDKFYMGHGACFDEEEDKQYIAAWGTPVHPEVMAEFFARPINRADSR